MNSVDSLVARAKKHHEQLLSNPFFEDLAAGKLDDLQWTRYLLYFCDHFTRCLSLRAGLCENDTYKNTFSDHDVEEGRHRKHLQAWMTKEEISIRGLRPTNETVKCADLLRRVAQYGEPDVQVFLLNVLAEGMALAFFTKAAQRLQHLNKLHGPYWHVHQMVDEMHLHMGIDLIKDVTDFKAEIISGLLDQAAGYFWEMIGSWRFKETTPGPM